MEHLTPKLITELLGTFNIYVFASIIAALTLREIAMAALNWLRMKWSDYGMGTKLLINGEVWYLEEIHFTQIQFRRKDTDNKMFMPISSFFKMNKVILYNGNVE